VIGMFYSEHGLPHFHAAYGEHEVSIEVETGTIHGQFPQRALHLVLEWADLHKAEFVGELATRPTGATAQADRSPGVTA
jgi:hypothetical protein